MHLTATCRVHAHQQPQHKSAHRVASPVQSLCIMFMSQQNAEESLWHHESSSMQVLGVMATCCLVAALSPAELASKCSLTRHHSGPLQACASQGKVCELTWYGVCDLLAALEAHAWPWLNPTSLHGAVHAPWHGHASHLGRARSSGGRLPQRCLVRYL